MLDQKSEEDNWWVKIGIGNLLPGMDAGYVGMCPGEIRKVTMPPDFHWDGHDTMKTPPVAKGNNVVYETELIDVRTTTLGLGGIFNYILPLSFIGFILYIVNFLKQMEDKYNQPAKRGGVKKQK